MKQEKRRKALKFFAVIFVMIVIFPCFTNSFGAINEKYQGATTSAQIGLNIDGSESNNVITKAIFWLINTVGSLGEYLLTAFASILASQAGDGKAALMPWADAIVYNGVPALDVNFINPAKGSFSSIMSGVISKIYYTIFSISITFFGIAVLIMAIKLATTAIAAEKARYKESITNFIISLILIFSMHYFMSFCFYLNESIVKVAFSIANVQLKGEFTKMTDSATEYQKALVNKISLKNSDNYYFDVETKENYKKLKNYISKKLFDDGQYQRAATLLAGGYGDFLVNTDGQLAYSADEVERSIILTCMADVVVKHSNDKVVFDEQTMKGYDNSGLTTTWKDVDALYLALKDSFYEIFVLSDGDDWPGFMAGAEDSVFPDVYKSCFILRTKAGKYGDQELTIMNAINNAVANINATGGDDTASATSMEDLGNSVVSQLSVYFKINRYTEEGDISLVGVIVYTIFVFQSIMYFFAYLKRFFYIIVLAFFAPFLVLFDFLSKAVGKQSDTLSKWIKEFCALVFVQSIQAFLLTMVAALIININTSLTDDDAALSASRAQGIAVINIIALASMAKLEELIGDMLGIKSSITDTSLKGGAKMGLHGFAGGMMTMGALRRLGDNGKKVFGGIRNNAAANKEYKNALNAKSRKLAQFQELSAGGAAGGGAGGGAAGGNGAVGVGVAGNGTSGGITIKDKHKYQDAMAACDDKINEALKKRRAAKLEMVSGLAETGGALVGAGFGAAAAGTYHAAAGNFDLADVMSDAIKGAGVGDALAGSVVNATTGTVGLAKDVKAGINKKAIIDKITTQKAEIKRMYQDAGLDVSDL